MPAGVKLENCKKEMIISGGCHNSGHELQTAHCKLPLPFIRHSLSDGGTATATLPSFHLSHSAQTPAMIHEP